MQPIPQIDELFDLSQYAHKKIFGDIENVWEALEKLSSYLKKSTLGSLQGEISDQAFLVNPELISIGIGSVVEPGAYIQGPCIIGDYCSIRHGAYIRGNVLVGDHCVIGHSTEVKNSIFLNHSQAAHFCYVGDSILGSHVNLGAGVKLANLLFNKKNIKINTNEGAVDTQRRKLGAVLGDYAQIGCNSVTNPGTILCKQSCVHPCINLGGIVSKEYVIKSNIEVISYPQRNYVLS